MMRNSSQIAMRASVNRYRDISRLTSKLVQPLSFSMTNRASRPFPNEFPNSSKGINGHNFGAIVTDNFLVPYSTDQSNSTIYVNPATPGCAKRLLALWIDQANSDCCTNVFQMSLLFYRSLREDEVYEDMPPLYNTVGTEEIYIFWYNIFVSFMRCTRNEILDEIALNWARRCCGVIRDGCYIGAKLEYAVIDVMMQHCPNTFRRQFNNKLEVARLAIPREVRQILCELADRNIKHHYKLCTWHHPDEDIMPNDYYEYKKGCGILHLSDVLVEPGWNDECTWVKDTSGYPLAPGDVNTNITLDTNPQDDEDYFLHGLPRNHAWVLEAKKNYDAYMNWWNTDPLDPTAPSQSHLVEMES